MSAADDINDFIFKAQSIADIERTNAEEYAHEAVLAVDSIRPVPVGVSISWTPGVGFKTVDVPHVPDLDVGLSDFDTVYTEIEANLTSAFAGFFGSYFPNVQSDHTNAVALLNSLAEDGLTAASVMLSRLSTFNDGSEGLGYLKGRLDTSRATEYINEGFESGRATRGVMQVKASGGGSAVSYLLGRFSAGDAAATQLIAMLTSGGTGLPAALEDAVWERDRARVLKEAERVKNTTINSMASRGFPLPPGALVSMLEMTEADSQDKISQQSRDVAIKQIETFIENIKAAAALAVSSGDGAGRAILADSTEAGRALLEDAQAGTRLSYEDAREAARVLVEDSLAATRAVLESASQAATSIVRLRSEAAQAAGSYISALARAPEASASVASALASARSSALSASANYYSAEAAAVNTYNNAYATVERLRFDSVLEPAKLAVQESGIINQTLIGVANAKANATIGAATAVGNMGAAALSSLNAIASLSSASSS